LSNNKKNLKEELRDTLNPWLADAVIVLINRELDDALEEWNQQLYMTIDENLAFKTAINRIRKSITWVYHKFKYQKDCIPYSR